MPRTHTWSTVLTLLLLTLLAALAVGVGIGVAESTSEPFEIEITEADTTVLEGKTIQVTATVTNTGNTTDSQQIHLKNDDFEIVDSIAGPPVTLGPGESENVTLTWESANGDAGVRSFGVQSNTDTATHTVEVRPGAFYEIDIVEANSPVTAGEPVDVVVNMTNIGNVSGMTGLSIAVDGSLKNRTAAGVGVLPGETTRTTLQWDSTEADVGEQTITAYTTTGVRTQTTVVIDEPEEPSGATAAEPETPTPTVDSETSTETTREGGLELGIIGSLLALFGAASFAVYRVFVG